MSHPRDILKRARRQRERRELSSLPRTPAPVAPVPPVPPVTPVAPVVQGAPSPARPQPAPKPAGHALYSELMRSHDRMGTRHLKT